MMTKDLKVKCISSLKFGTIICASLSLLACKTLTDWVEGEDNVSQPAALVEFEAEKQVQPDWQILASNGQVIAQKNLDVALSDNILYIAGQGGQISALDKENAQVLWRITVNSEISSGPVVNDQLLLVTTRNGQVIALNTTDGTEKWRAKISNDVLAAPAVDDRYVVVKTIDDKLFGYSATDGELLWQYAHGAADITLRASSRPIISGNYLVVGFADGKLDVLELATGTLIWQRPVSYPTGVSLVEQMVGILADPIIDNGIIYVSTYQGRVAAIELGTGRDIWQREMSVHNNMLLSNDRLYITDASGHVWALNKADGIVLWRQENIHSRGLTAPTVIGDSVVVGDRFGYVHWLDKNDGRFVARNQLESSLLAAPLGVDDKLFVLSQDGQLTRYRVNA